MTFFNGNISIAAESKYNEKIGDNITTFSVAENRPLSKGGSKTVYHRISIFGKRGRNLQEYLYLGRPVVIFGYEEARGYIGKNGDAVSYLQMNNARVIFPTKNAKDADPTDGVPEEEFDLDDVVVEEGPIG